MRVLILALLSTLCPSPSLAAAGVSHTAVQASPYLTGYFGGIRSGPIFKLLLTRHGGVVYYRISQHEAARCARLPLNSPVRILVDKGLITSFQLLEGPR